MEHHSNKLVLVGNGFDLAHGLKTRYKNFLDWYICMAFDKFLDSRFFEDKIIRIEGRHTGMYSTFKQKPTSYEEVFRFLGGNNLQSVSYPSRFMEQLIASYKDNKWVDIERYYFSRLKTFFSSSNLENRAAPVQRLNSDFDFLIEKLSEYITTINASLDNVPKLESVEFKNIFKPSRGRKLKFLNFNYTETLHAKYSLLDGDVISIHGRVANIRNNRILPTAGTFSNSAC
jgi:hypothetical protein